MNEGLNRHSALERIRQADTPWDILIIGGGATGVGIAVDAASRGFRTVLVEQSDFGKGTSSRSTKLIHGGVRYLQQGNLMLVRDALRERDYLRKNAPHLVKEMPFLIPCRNNWERFYFWCGLKIYDMLALGHRRFSGSYGVSRSKAKKMVPALQAGVLNGGVVYHDGQFDDARLLINMVRTASDNGGCLVNYAPVRRLLFNDQKHVIGAQIVDHETGEELQIRSRCVINATGPFSDDIRKMGDSKSDPIIAASQGVHVVLPRRFYPGRNATIVPKTADGRVVFLIPWHDRVIVGTTDTAINQVQLEPTPQEQEVDFLLNTVNDYLEIQPTREDLRAVFTGTRPLVKNNRKIRTASLSRDHVVKVSRQRLVTIAGGKWTTFRRMAEDCIDRVINEFQLEPLPCKTKTLPIHGSAINPGDMADERSYYGADLTQVQTLERQIPKGSELLHPDLALRTVDIIWAVRQEMARTVDDVLARRTRSLFCDARAAIEVAPQVVSLMAKEMGTDERWCERQLSEFRDVANHFLVR